MLIEEYAKLFEQKYSYLPWFTFPAIEYLLQLDLIEKNVFEWGSGDSTRFFAARCKSVVSVEHDPTYYNKCKGCAANVELHLCDINNFVEIIDKYYGLFDVIVIDSERRMDCCKKALEHLHKFGLIIFDNSNWHGTCCKFLRDAKLLQVDFHGMGPRNIYAWTTSLFFSRDFNFNLLVEPQPQAPIFGDLVVVKSE